MSQTPKPRKQVVRWSPEELKALIDEAVIVSIEDTDHLWCHLNKAQETALPPDRHRLIGGKHIATAEITRQFVEARRQFLARKDEVEAPAPVLSTATDPVPTPTPQPEPRPVVQPVVDRATVIDSITNEELLELVKRRLSPILEGIGVLAGFFKSQLFGSVTSPAPATDASTPPVKKDEGLPNPPATKGAIPSTPPPAPPAPPPEPKMTKVLIFNFPLAITEEVKRKSGNFNLQLLFATQVQGEGAPRIPVCNWCIVNDRIELSRRAKAALHARPGKERLYYLGSAEAVLRRLNVINSMRRAS